MAIASWLTPASKSGTGNKIVNLTASKNPGASRTTIITVTVSGITKTINCTQTEQDKFTLKVSSTTLNSAGTEITNIGECSIGSASNAGVSTGTYYRDTSQTITAKAAPTGYSFVGWYEGSNLISSSLQVSVTMSANRTLVAKYQIKTYVVNAVSDDTTKGIVSPAGQTVEHGKNATVTASRKTGYKFDGWYNGSTKVTSTNPYTFAPTANITLTAKWAINTVSDTIKISPSGGGTVSPNPIIGQENTAISTTATPATGYNFKHWRYNNSSASGGYLESTTNPLKIIVTGKRDVTAVFELKSYIVTWNANGGTVSPTSVSKTHGSTLGTLPTATRTGYTFKGWSTSKTGPVNISTTTKVTANVTYYAVWTINSYTWTFDANGGTGDTTKTLNYNATLSTLPTASRASTAVNNYTFAGWFDTDASTGGTQLTTSTKCTGNKTWYARWTASTRQYKLTVTAGTGGTVSGGGTYNYNASVTLKATANSGYHFVKWSDGNTSATRTVTVTKDATYTATFEQDPYLNLDKTSLEFKASGGTQTVNVTSNVSWTVS